MSNDLFHLVESLDHDYLEEHGERVHSYQCRRCQIFRVLSELKQSLLLRHTDLNKLIGSPKREPEKPRS